MRAPVVLVTAKAPVPGRVKTRLAADVGAGAAADLAAAALLDTLAACAQAFGAGRCYLALAGRLDAAARRAEIDRVLAGWTVLPQRGAGLAERLAAAHHDVAAASGAPVLQVGMDTPQLTADDLDAAAALLGAGPDAVLAPAEDGGWWALGLRDPGPAKVLRGVPMSTPATYRRTREALRAAGARVARGSTLRDVDHAADAERVAALAPDNRFAAAWRALRAEAVAR